MDLLYLIFFFIHVPIMFTVDLVPLYPASLTPEFLLSIRADYIATYSDQFFVSPPPFFTLYMWMEVFFHVPVSVWAVGALLRDDSKTPLVMLVWAVQTALTTGTCVYDYMHWVPSGAETLNALYLPYLALSIVMCVDFYWRLSKQIDVASTIAKAKKTI